MPSYLGAMLTGTILSLVVPVAAPVTADETEALKAEITKAVKQVQEAGGSAGCPSFWGPGSLYQANKSATGGQHSTRQKSRELLLKQRRLFSIGCWLCGWAFLMEERELGGGGL